MKIDKDSFFGIFETKFWTKLRESIVPFGTTPNKREFLETLHEQITNFTYHPDPPREYIVINKHNGISRYVPTFSRKDYCVYFLCIKLLEEEIAVNRVEGTFGGWTLGNQIRLKEEAEIIELEYIPFNTFNELSWIKEWQSFQKISITYRDLEDWNCFYNLDIANFYDCINLTILERKIRHAVSQNKQDVVTLLFHFLRNWNKKLEGYNYKTVGIPQDEIGDCSRILANFYLQEYDQVINKFCSENQAKFIRFADDQIIYSKDLQTARNILFESSKELLRINLNLNSSKAREFKNKEAFNSYWAYKLFEKFNDPEDEESINQAIEVFLYNIEHKIPFREDSILKRILKMNKNKIQRRFRHRLIGMFLDPDFLAQLRIWHLKRIRIFIDNDKEFFEELDNLIPSVQFNSYHYNLLAFYKKERKDYDTSELVERIEQMKLK